MDLGNDKPRTQPAPVPYCESYVKPIVPELSLLSLDSTDDNAGRRTDDPCRNGQYQSYNAWKWKYMSDVDKVVDDRARSKADDKCSSVDRCILIKDKYSSSETEKRKNEILYGRDEPRRPILPKVFPEIPNCTNLFSNKAFDDFSTCENVCRGNTSRNLTNGQEGSKPVDKPVSGGGSGDGDDLLTDYMRKGFDTSNKLYQIMSEQNNQIQILQKQIEQILKLQDVKDKQIEQLLSGQESKERKIEQLLQSLSAKDRERDQLLKLDEQRDRNLKNLLKSQKEWESKNVELLQRVKELQERETSSVGTMTCIKMVDASTNTEAVHNTHEIYSRSNNENKQTDTENITRPEDRVEAVDQQERDRSLSLHSTDLPPFREHVPTPQGSIHLDIQDFHYSSDESDSEPGTSHYNRQTSHVGNNKLGFTFYNNVISQVKDIIQKSGEREPDSGIASKTVTENNCIRGQRGSMQSFQTWEVLERENIPPPILPQHMNKNFNGFPYDQSNAYLMDAYSPSDISLKINSLALKYLKQEQISQYNIQPQIPTPRHHDVTIYNVTNLSFGSTRYLDRCRILSNIDEKQVPQQGSGSPRQVYGTAPSARVRKRIHPSGHGPTHENVTHRANVMGQERKLF